MQLLPWMCHSRRLHFFITLHYKNVVMRKHKILETPHIKAVSNECIACLKCIESCPGKVFGAVKFLWHKHAVIIAPDNCIGCGKCVVVCPRSIFEKK